VTHALLSRTTPRLGATPNNARTDARLTRVALSQLLATGVALAANSSRDYRVINAFERNGSLVDSGTQNVAEEGLRSDWVWDDVIGGVSLLVMSWALWVAWSRPLSNQEAL
jgi:hypothetical protein